MRRTSFEQLNCSVAQTLEVVGDWRSLLVLREIFFGVTRFDDIQRRLGIARNTLTDRLDWLCRHGVLIRMPYGESGNRLEYRLTDKGCDLHPVLLAMLDWGDKWGATAKNPPLRPCDQNGDPIELRIVNARRHSPSHRPAMSRMPGRLALRRRLTTGLTARRSVVIPERRQLSETDI